MTYRELEVRTAERLRDAGIENYRAEARNIARHFEKINNVLPRDTVDEATAEVWESVCAGRENRRPLQYLLGEWEFYGDRYLLNSDCLIPRPETEMLTEYIIRHAPPDAGVADLCCGSGCIAISALKRRHDLHAVGVDIAEGAISAAAANAKLNGVDERIRFCQLDIITEKLRVKEAISGCTVLVSNPPYLSRADMDTVRREATEVSHEPAAALYGGPDGTDFYAAITGIYLARSRSMPRLVLFEAGFGQSRVVADMLTRRGYDAFVHRDLAGIGRLVVGVLP